MKIVLLILLLSTEILAKSVHHHRNQEGTVRVGDGKTHKYSTTVTRDGETESYNVEYTDNSVHTDGIRHSGGGTINIGQKNVPGESGKWWNSGSGDLNIGNGDRSENGFNAENVRTSPMDKRDDRDSWKDDVEDSKHEVSEQDDRSESVNPQEGNVDLADGARSKRGVWDVNVDTNTNVNWRQDNINYRDNSVTSNGNFKYGDGNMNIGNGDRSKRGVWDVNVNTDTNVNWRKDNLEYRDNSVTSNNNRMYGNGNMNIANGDRSKRNTRIDYRHKDNSIWVKDATLIGQGSINIGNGDRSKRGVWDVNVNTNTDVNWRQNNVNWRDNSVTSNGNVKVGDGHMNIANGDRSKRGVWDVKVDTHTNVNWRKDNIEYRDNSVTSNNNFKYGEGNMNIGNGDRSKRDSLKVQHTDNSIHVDSPYIHGSGVINIGNGRRGRREAELELELDDDVRVKREFFGSVAVHDRRTRPGPPVNLSNLEGRGSVHIIIDDNTDPITLRGAKVIGSAQINIGG